MSAVGQTVHCYGIMICELSKLKNQHVDQGVVLPRTGAMVSRNSDSNTDESHDLAAETAMKRERGTAARSQMPRSHHPHKNDERFSSSKPPIMMK